MSASNGSWQGWRPLPADSVEGGWVDLSHAVSAEMPRIDFFPAPSVERVRSMPGDPFNLTEVHMVCHSGTHVDAPVHFIEDGPTIEEVPLERLMGDGVLWRFEDLEEYGEIRVEHLAAAQPAVRDGDVVLLDTGWAARFPADAYARHPSLTVEAARWLVQRGAKLIGVDFATPDLSAHLRREGFDWPVHHVLLSHGVLIVEHLRNLDRLAPGRISLLCLPLSVEGGDGAPARVLARPSTTTTRKDLRNARSRHL